MFLHLRAGPIWAEEGKYFAFCLVSNQIIVVLSCFLEGWICYACWFFFWKFTYVLYIQQLRITRQKIFSFYVKSKNVEAVLKQLNPIHHELSLPYVRTA